MKSNEKVTDKRLVKLENVMAKDYIPLFEGRPQREIPISRDDLINLKIALNSSADLDDFLSRV